jgi:hypothetical protein
MANPLSQQLGLLAVALSPELVLAHGVTVGDQGYSRIR